jgi:hypothetical protein
MALLRRCLIEVRARQQGLDLELFCELADKTSAIPGEQEVGMHGKPTTPELEDSVRLGVRTEFELIKVTLADKLLTTGVKAA